MPCQEFPKNQPPKDSKGGPFAKLEDCKKQIGKEGGCPCCETSDCVPDGVVPCGVGFCVNGESCVEGFCDGGPATRYECCTDGTCKSTNSEFYSPCCIDNCVTDGGCAAGYYCCSEYECPSCVLNPPDDTYPC